ncbi:hypothetical protein HK404_28895, partial [Myxococcus xanthus]|nr:hypothetical protein [Myxococcus xanthus]
IANLPAVTHPYFATAAAAIPNPPLAAVQAALGLARSAPIDPATRGLQEVALATG